MKNEKESEKERGLEIGERDRGNGTMKSETCFYSAEKPVSAPTYGRDSRDYFE